MFEECNRVRCFNHTIQLAGKVLIKPFNSGMSKAEDSIEISASNAQSLEGFNQDDDIDDDAGICTCPKFADKGWKESIVLFP